MTKNITFAVTMLSYTLLGPILGAFVVNGYTAIQGFRIYRSLVPRS